MTTRQVVLTEDAPQGAVLAPGTLVPIGGGYYRIAGSEGPAGATGATGPQGTQGAVGSVGPAGVQGSSGPAGATGSPGATGPQGTQGTPAPSPTLQILAVQPVITRYQQRPAPAPSQQTTACIAQQIALLQAERDALLATIRRSAGRTQDKNLLKQQVDTRYGNQIAALLAGSTGRTATGSCTSAPKVTRSGPGRWL